MPNIVSTDVIAARILIIRGKRVILDKDLAQLYEVQTRILNQAVKRNINRFPDDFMFCLTREEIKRISQIVISLKFSKNVFAFTEQGVAMLSSVLNSERAIKVNIQIMRAFVKLKEYIFAHKELSYKLRELEEKIGKHDIDIQEIFEVLRQLLTPPVKKRKIIGFHP